MKCKENNIKKTNSTLNDIQTPQLENTLGANDFKNLFYTERHPRSTTEAEDRLDTLIKSLQKGEEVNKSPERQTAQVGWTKKIFNLKVVYTGFFSCHGLNLVDLSTLRDHLTRSAARCSSPTTRRRSCRRGLCLPRPTRTTS